MTIDPNAVRARIKDLTYDGSAPLMKLAASDLATLLADCERMEKIIREHDAHATPECYALEPDA